jgi:opacity protein-like surface antigen
MTRVIMSVILFVTFLAGPAAAREGFYLGAFYPRNSIAKDIEGLERGDGLGVRAGLGTGEHFAMELAFFETDHAVGAAEEWKFKGGTFDLKVFMPITGITNVEPFITGGIGKYSLDTPTGVYRGNVDQIYRYTESDGTVHDWKTSFFNGYQFGAGANIFISPELSVDLGYVVRKMYFDWNTPGGEELRSRVRSLEAGVSYHF